MSKRTILETTDYDQFKRVVGNRPIDISHVNQLISLNAEMNMMWQFPAIVSKDGYLFDGQHRREAARAQGWPFYYTVSTESIDDLVVARINRAQHGWKPDNYVDFFAERGDKQYQFLKSCKEVYKVTTANLCMMFGYKSTTALKMGKVVFYSTREEKDLLVDLIEGYLALEAYFDRAVFTDRDFVGAIRIMFQQVSAEQIIDAVAKASVAITIQNTSKDYLRLFESIFNKYKHGEKNYVRFF